MHAFKYLSVLISIVLGLGITQLLSAFARWLELRAEVKPYGPAALWAAFLMLVSVQTWWAMFGLRESTSWTFLQFAMVLTQPMLLFLLTTLALPGPASAERDLKAWFFRHRVWFFSLFLGLLAVSVAKDVVVGGRLPSAPNLAFHAGLAACGAAALASRRDGVQLAAGLAAVGLIVAYVGVLFANLA